MSRRFHRNAAGRPEKRWNLQRPSRSTRAHAHAELAAQDHQHLARARGVGIGFVDSASKQPQFVDLYPRACTRRERAGFPCGRRQSAAPAPRLDAAPTWTGNRSPTILKREFPAPRRSSTERPGKGWSCAFLSGTGGSTDARCDRELIERQPTCLAFLVDADSNPAGHLSSTDIIPGGSGALRMVVARARSRSP